MWKATNSPIAKEALDRIGAFYDIERRIIGTSAAQRLAVRQKESRPRTQAFRAWCESQLARIPGKGGARQCDALRAQPLACFHVVPRGRPCCHRQQCCRARHSARLHRKKELSLLLFAGSDAGGEIIADAMTLVKTAELSGFNPQDYLADVLARINDHIVSRLDELLPWNWKQLAAPQDQAA